MTRNSLRTSPLFLALLLLFPAAAFAASAKTSMRLLYPSFAGSWATAWIAKEAGYFLDEGLDVELIRVGGSTRMVAAMLGGSAPIIQAGAVAALTATLLASGSRRTNAKHSYDDRLVLRRCLASSICPSSCETAPQPCTSALWPSSWSRIL